MKTLVILSGWGEDSTDNPEVAETAPKNWTVFKLSCQELMPNAKVSEAILYLHNFLEANKIDETYLLGSSLGGLIAMEYTIRYPQQVKKLYLANSEGIKTPLNILKLSINFVRSNPTLFTRKLSQVVGTVPGILARPRWNMKVIKLAEELSMEKLASQIKVPTTIIWGDQDLVTPLWHGERLNQLIPNSTLVVIPGLKHDWLISHPKKFWQNI